MKSARFSLQVWGIYLFAIGAGLLVLPGTILSLMGFVAPVEPWIRVVGVLVVILGYIYFRCAGADLRAVYPWSIHGRWSAVAAFIALVVLNLAPVNLLLFAAVDFLGGLWTFLALRSEAA